MKLEHFYISVRLWEFEFTITYNKGLKQFGFFIGKRFFTYGGWFELKRNIKFKWKK